MLKSNKNCLLIIVTLNCTSELISLSEFNTYTSTIKKKHIIEWRHELWKSLFIHGRVSNHIFLSQWLLFLSRGRNVLSFRQNWIVLRTGCGRTILLVVALHPLGKASTWHLWIADILTRSVILRERIFLWCLRFMNYSDSQTPIWIKPRVARGQFVVSCCFHFESAEL